MSSSTRTVPDIILLRLGKKGKGSCSLVIATLTNLDSGAFTASEVAADWH